MRTRRTAALATLFLLSSLGLGAAPAGAAPVPAADPTPLAGASLYAQDSALRGELGADSAGTYVDAKTGGLVVTVTSERAAAKVRAAGGTARVVARSAARLAGAVAVLEERAKIAGTSWGLDPRTNQIAVEADRTVSARDLARLRKVADSLGGAVRIARVPGVLKKEIIGGDAIYGGGYRCSSAFNVKKGTATYFVTAGHCTNAAASWSATSGGPVVGAREGTSFPTNDYGLVRFTDGSSPGGTVNKYNGSAQDISSAADAVVGQSLQKSGSTTKLTSGKVTAVNVTVNYGDGPVYGMVRTTACSAGGDSGGAHFAGGVALGIHSGSSGCTGTAGSAIHQPVKEALSVYGVSVY
ncbi:S1 family peptidase [Streptomyces sp. NBC_00237]|uniref:S1 family peptidase n=1 Tax=Streptomyces sp. NBC_00237 TaxID=2975687 RepID=UPI0022559A60|nr:S1 family peptidase [Streptomyces sp. NBC_00237]MCX5204012.1 S1 family peptidase [Streptomyces sp. NBC_00237]